MKRIVAFLISILILVSASPISAGGTLAISETSAYRFSTDRVYVTGIAGVPTVAEFISNFTDPESVTVKTPAGDIREGSVASDDIASNGSTSVRILIYGDVDRNGRINARDVICTMKLICDPSLDVCKAASDVNEDGKTNAFDVITLMKFLVGDYVELGVIKPPACEFKIDSTYRIVLSEDADETEEEAADLLSTALDSLYNTGMGKRWITYDIYDAAKEIIVGETNRANTKKQLNKLTGEGFLYNIISPEKIVIAGTDPEGTYEAVERFLWDNFGYIDIYNTINSAKIWNGEEYVNIKGSTTLKSSKSLFFEYPETKSSLTINDTPISDFTVVPRDEVYAGVADILIRNIRLMTGITLPSDVSYTGDNMICVGRVPSGGNYTNAALAYNVGSDGSSVYIDAYRLNVCRFAVRAFSLKYLRYSSPGEISVEIVGNILGAYNSNLLDMTSNTSSALTDGIMYRELTFSDRHGLPVKAFAVEIENGAGTLRLGTPNGESEIAHNAATTTAEMRTLMNAGDNVIAGVNGDFFKLGGNNQPLGIAVKDGTVMQQANGRPWFAVFDDGSFGIGTGNDSRKVIDRMVTAIGGSHVLVKNGMIREVAQDTDFGGIRHPRTAVGYNADGDVILLVVDGRRPNYSNGASLTDLALMLIDLGATEAMNLDGGGSSTLATVESGEINIKNSPSDILERAVYDSLIVTIEN